MPHIFYGISIGWKAGFFGDNLTNQVTRIEEKIIKPKMMTIQNMLKNIPRNDLFSDWELFNNKNNQRGF